MKFGILPWLERGHAFTQNIKNHLFRITTKRAYSSTDDYFSLFSEQFPSSAGRRRTVLNWLLGSSAELVAGQFGRVGLDHRCLRDGGIPSEE